MSDAELVARVRAGDHEAYARLVDRYRDPIWAFVQQRMRDRAATEDVAQETFVVAYTRIASLAEPAQFAGWLFGIARNLSARARRDGRARGSVPGAAFGPGYEMTEAEAVAALAGEDPPPEVAQVEERDLAAAVGRALGALDDPYRAALTLRFREGRSYREVAAALGFTIGTVSSLIHRGLSILAPRLAPLGRAVVGEVETDAALAARAAKGEAGRRVER